MLMALQRATFEPFQSTELKIMSINMLLTALASTKRVGDLHAFLVNESCLEFGYVPKVSTKPFRDQVVNLQELPSEEADPAQLYSVPFLLYVTMWTICRALGHQSSSSSITECSGRDKLTPSRV